MKEKVMIGTPMHKCKYYMIEEFTKNINNIDDYFYVFINDNSYGNKDSRINQTDSLNKLRDIFLKSDCSHLLLVEADIMPKKNVISELLKHDKDVVSTIYLIDKKKGRFNVTIEAFAANNKSFSNFFINSNFIDGELKEVPHSAGMGCVLIKRKVIEQIKFRSGQWHPDIYWWEDIKAYGFKGYVDTSIIVRHYPNKESGKIFLKEVKNG